MKVIIILVTAFCFSLLTAPGNVEESMITKQGTIKLGAYYFDGWKSKSKHITESLVKQFPEREPKWGWVTGTQEILDKQIDEAAGAGISFFSFCWYFKNGKHIDSTNRIVRLYHNSPSKGKLQYCLMVANHEGFLITPESWSDVVEEWIKQFKTKNYLLVNQKPLLIFFSQESLIHEFGTEVNVKKAFDVLKKEAVRNGLKGVTIASCISPEIRKIREAEACGFDVLTGYNYCGAGFKGRKGPIPISNLQSEEPKVWSRFQKITDLKYIPLSTLNWDPRPWANADNKYNEKPYYVGFSEESVFNSVLGLTHWLNENQMHATQDKIALLYAWNENGEGAYLTPSLRGVQPLKGVRRAMMKK